jgi:glycosyltransferase involved in cell wall biosynthesis
MIINQFHSGTAVGDAITNQMLSICSILKKMGHKSKIYAQHIPKELESEIFHISNYKENNVDSILIVHHSMGFDLFDEVIGINAKKVLIYHNITPEKFFDNPGIKKYIRIGLKQAREYQKYVDYAIADSNFSRRELLEMGYKNVDVMPVQAAIDNLIKREGNKNIEKEFSETRNFLFVGRVVPNKCQEDIINIFYEYINRFEENSRLILVGDMSQVWYVEKLKEQCRILGIEKQVVFTGKVSDDDLKSYYKSADIFLCMSEHEGFGVPLLEAINFEVPLIAYHSSAVAETMDGAGVIVKYKDFAAISALAYEININSEFRDRLIKRQSERLISMEQTRTECILENVINNVITNSRKKTLQIQGPFESTYSLAQVNRKLAESLNSVSDYDVSIHCTEGMGDYEPNIALLKDKPIAKELWEKSKNFKYPDITIRNMYPPRVHDSKGGLNLLYFGWEESIIPAEYVENFNKYCDGIGVMSQFVKDSLKNCGVNIPMEVVGVGVESYENASRDTFKIKTKKNTKFLHISSAFPRKGIDILLKSYYETFTSDDDVCLIIKSFPNPHNNVTTLLETYNINYSNAPEVVFINQDLSEAEVASLYKQSTCYVHVARGEGFGLPVAEAMLYKIPVIVSNNTGLADFCNEKSAKLVKFSMVEADSHLSTVGSVWAEPDSLSLSHVMRQFVDNLDEKENLKQIEFAYNLIKSTYSWEAVSSRWLNFIKLIEENKRKPIVAIVSTWNSKCGIAEYTRLLVNQLESKVKFEIYSNSDATLVRADEDNVCERIWATGNDSKLDNLVNQLSESISECVHIQYNFGFFSLQELKKLIYALHEQKHIVLTLHATKDATINGSIVSLKSISDALNLIYKIIVHQDEDKARLIKMGVDSKIIKVVALGQLKVETKSKFELREQIGINKSPVLGSYGFLLPHKGIKEIIEAVSILKKQYPNILYIAACSLYDVLESQQYYRECKLLIDSLGVSSNVVLVTEFLQNEESMAILQMCDMLLMPYLPTKESASGAIRFCLASEKPTIVTKQEIFKEFVDCTYQIEKCKSELIVNAVLDLLENQEVQEIYIKAIKQRIEDTCWEKIGDVFFQLYSL